MHLIHQSKREINHAVHTRDYEIKIEQIRKFWDEFIYDDVMATNKPVGSKYFFADLESFRYQRLDYLARILDFSFYKDKKILDVGCRIGLDLARFAENGAFVTGIDLSDSCIETARQYFALKGLQGDFLVMNGESMEFEDNSFDLVYSHGVIQYTADPSQMLKEMHRVLRDDGEVILMAYNRYSWLSLLSKFSGKGLTHEEAPFFEPYSIGQFYRLMKNYFSNVEILVERFPTNTGLHRGLLAKMYYAFFVGTFNLLPNAWVRKFGAHLIARARK